MIVPALIYAAVAWRDPAALRGWAVPTATDIVLAVSVLTLVGPRINPALRAFLTALAIFDDIGAIVIIGLFYDKGLALAPLALASLALLGLWIVNRRAIEQIWPYAVLGAVLWASLYDAGLEAALSGVLIGIAIPLRAGGHSPLQRAERALEPWVSFAVIPLFAFFNSGVAIGPDAFAGLRGPAFLGIVLGLLVGKPIGIIGTAWIAVRIGAGHLPRGVRWGEFRAVSLVAGIGFTMSLFVAGLAFLEPGLLASAKLAVLTGSLVAASIGFVILRAVTIPQSSDPAARPQPGRAKR